MFQPARPPLMWSSEAYLRAMWNGSLYVVEAVATRPMRLVTAASADRSVSGSSSAFWAERHSEPGGLSSPRMPIPSARNTMSKQARSAVCATRTKWLNLEAPPGSVLGWRQAAAW